MLRGCSSKIPGTVVRESWKVVSEAFLKGEWSRQKRVFFEMSMKNIGGVWSSQFWNIDAKNGM